MCVSTRAGKQRLAKYVQKGAPWLPGPRNMSPMEQLQDNKPQKKQTQQPQAAPCPECSTPVPRRKVQPGERYVGYCKPCKDRAKNTRPCAACSEPFLPDQHDSGRVDYCQACLGQMAYAADDLIVLYRPNERHIFKVGEEDRAARLLGDLGHVVYRTDLHDCLDCHDPALPLFTNGPSMCISYVGALSTKRREAEVDIEVRLATGQISFGCLVFSRGKGEDRDAFHEPGSKAWVNKSLTFQGHAIFFDDATDHQRSVQSLGIPGLRSVLVTDEKSMLTALEKFKPLLS